MLAIRCGRSMTGAEEGRVELLSGSRMADQPLVTQLVHNSTPPKKRREKPGRRKNKQERTGSSTYEKLKNETGRKTHQFFYYNQSIQA